MEDGLSLPEVTTEVRKLPHDEGPAPVLRTWLDSITGGNQFMSAGFGVMAVGAGIALARSGIKRAAGFAKHQMLGESLHDSMLNSESNHGNTFKRQVIFVVSALDVELQIAPVTSFFCRNAFQAA